MGTQHNVRLAVLIDADNAQSSIIRELLVEVSKYGVATVKRVYGDWTTPNLRGWKETLNQHALQPIQQFSYTSGKNATDCALIIDAMDLLHSGRVDGFCLVSSDSDFTRLATRIRESGLVVYGFGEQKTPPPFVVACDKFVYTEILRAATSPAPTAPVETAGSKQLESILKDAVTAAMRDDGWAPLSGVGALITKTNPDFDARNYGYAKLSGLMRAQAFLELKTVSSSEGIGAATLYVRFRDEKQSRASASSSGT
ncbi:NYN domain-containing protein [Massilia sp. G4R7]|uniref:NYN domain-containing protein n=1 Tax=Massilia phyllostachyos TaxID=2898585 RepID=A0ABS8Q1C1_9BURK|nr:NYN domain-containing protein [Massilia phyllostachyos]MCD2514867.1 NYN domain-containing protein [Massilia phyllostachyos]